MNGTSVTKDWLCGHREHHRKPNEKRREQIGKRHKNEEEPDGYVVCDDGGLCDAESRVRRNVRMLDEKKKRSRGAREMAVGWSGLYRNLLGEWREVRGERTKREKENWASPDHGTTRWPPPLSFGRPPSAIHRSLSPITVGGQLLHNRLQRTGIQRYTLGSLLTSNQVKLDLSS